MSVVISENNQFLSLSSPFDYPRFILLLLFEIALCHLEKVIIPRNWVKKWKGFIGTG